MGCIRMRTREKTYYPHFCRKLPFQYYFIVFLKFLRDLLERKDDTLKKLSDFDVLKPLYMAVSFTPLVLLGKGLCTHSGSRRISLSAMSQQVRHILMIYRYSKINYNCVSACNCLSLQMTCFVHRQNMTVGRSSLICLYTDMPTTILECRIVFLVGSSEVSRELQCNTCIYRNNMTSENGHVHGDTSKAPPAHPKSSPRN